jgi:hypothetical protein
MGFQQAYTASLGLSCEKSGRYLTALVSASRVNRDYAGAGGVDWMLFAAPNKGPPVSARPKEAQCPSRGECSCILHSYSALDLSEKLKKGFP